MKEPKRIKLTDSPESKKVTLRPLTSNDFRDIGLIDIKNNTNENNQQNNSQSIQQLESDPSD